MSAVATLVRDLPSIASFVAQRLVDFIDHFRLAVTKEVWKQEFLAVVDWRTNVALLEQAFYPLRNVLEAGDESDEKLAKLRASYFRVAMALDNLPEPLDRTFDRERPEAAIHEFDRNLKELSSRLTDWREAISSHASDNEAQKQAQQLNEQLSFPTREGVIGQFEEAKGRLRVGLAQLERSGTARQMTDEVQQRESVVCLPDRLTWLTVLSNFFFEEVAYRGHMQNHRAQFVEYWRLHVAATSKLTDPSFRQSIATRTPLLEKLFKRVFDRVE